MDSWGILNVDTAAIAISREDNMQTSFRRKHLIVSIVKIIIILKKYFAVQCEFQYYTEIYIYFILNQIDSMKK
ncbi:hypothetical protein RR48_03303 [Papilio machaon]|uniref:Uncharacterized protein n=1 Tax=Papilio machaon TaxID=76193 RepID=A0A0N0PAL2_PAPMA|nr:hypothetical protein RR48_03303 [Papilio machaon]